jgi:hypothetical protein
VLGRLAHLGENRSSLLLCRRAEGHEALNDILPLVGIT